jgi:hypothetical protein
MFIRAGNGIARRLWEEMVFSPNFTSLILIRGDELRVRAPMACLPSRERLTVGEFYLLHSTSRGDMQLLLAHVRAMDLDVWPADGTALVTKVGRTLDKLKSSVESKRILRASDEDFRAWSGQSLFDKYVSVRAKPRGLKGGGVGSRDATNVNSALGDTSTAAGGADVLAFGGLGTALGGNPTAAAGVGALAFGVGAALCGNFTAASEALPFGDFGAKIGDARDGTDLELLALGESRSLNYHSNILSVFTEMSFVYARHVCLHGYSGSASRPSRACTFEL